MRTSQVVRLLERSARSGLPRPPRAAKKGGLIHCGLVLQKMEGRSHTNYPNADLLWRDRLALSRDVANVMVAMSTASRWEPLFEQVHALATDTTAYFADIRPNPARDEFLAEWELVRSLAL